MRRLLPWLLLTPGAAAQNTTTDPGNETASLVLDRFNNPLPAPLDGEVGVFLLNVVAWVVIGFAAALFLNPFAKTVAKRIPGELDDHIVRIITRPTFIVIVAYGTKQSVEAFRMHPLVHTIIDHAWTVLWMALATLVIYRLWSEVIRGVGRRVAAKTESDLDDRLYPLFDKLGGIIVLFAGLWFIIASFGVDMTLIAAGGAIGGLVIAFAAQDTLGNLFAGVFILLDRPFREGDRIEIQELGTWGDVTEIGLRTTRIRTRDNRMVIVPNAVIGGNAVVNHSYPDPKYRIGVDVGIAYGSDIEKARSVMLEALGKVEGVLKDERMEALFQGFGDSALQWHARAWFPHFVDKRRYEDKIYTALEKGLREAGIEIPFPQRVVHMAHKS